MFGWIKNGPDIEKPVGQCVLRTAPADYWFAVWFQHRQTGVWMWLAGDEVDGELEMADEHVTHFALITEPTDV